MVALLGGRTEEATERAEESVALARQSGMAGAVVMSLNSLALTLAENDPVRARELLSESLELGGRAGEEVSSGLLTACMLAGRLRDWNLTRTLTGRTLHPWRGYVAPLQAGPCLALCARAFAEDRPEVAGVVGAAFATFRSASRLANPTRPSRNPPADTDANFVLVTLRETALLVAAALSDKRARELRIEGDAMSMEAATSYALAHIDPRLLTGPISVQP